MKKIYCLGEAVHDMIFRAEARVLKNGQDNKLLCFEYGDKINVPEFHETCGGSALNISVGLKKLGLDPSIIASVGNDDRGKKIKEVIKKEDVSNSFLVQRGEFSTKTSGILLSPEGDRTILVYHGKGVLKKEDINWDKIENGVWFYLGPLPDNTQELINKVLEVKKEKKLNLAVNLGSIQVKWGREENSELVKECDLLILNSSEAEDFFGESYGDMSFLEEFIKGGAKKVVITRGENGSIASSGEKIYETPALKTKTVDSTGAGDSFTSGVLGSLMMGVPFEEALVFGVINSSSVVSNFGAQEGLLTLEEIKKKKVENKDLRPKVIK